MQSSPSGRDMASENAIDLTEAVVTCEGNLHDPDFSTKFQLIVDKLKSLLYKSRKEEVFKVRKIEPWNSVRVTISIPKEAAQRLRVLAQQGNQVLRQLGILSVQVEGDQVISLTLAGKNNEPQELILAPQTNYVSNTAINNSLSVPSASAFLSSLVPNTGNQMSRQNQNQQPSTSSTHPSQHLTFHQQPTATPSTLPFVSPNVVAPIGESIPSLPKTSAPTPRPVHGGPFSFSSMTHAVHTLQRSDSSSSGGKSPSHSSSSAQSAVVGSSNNLIRSTNRAPAPPVLQGVISPSPTLTRSDQTRFIYNNNSGIGSMNVNANVNLVANSHPASSSSASSQSLQGQFVEATPTTATSSLPPPPPYTQHQQFSISSGQGHLHPPGTITSDKPNSSPLLVNLLQYGDGVSPTASTPTPMNPPGIPAEEEARTSMPPPPLSISLSLENPKVKRYQLLQQQRNLKRGLSLDMGLTSSPTSEQTPMQTSPLTSSSIPSPLGQETFNHLEQPPLVSTTNQSQSQGQGQLRQMTLYQQGGKFRIVNPSQIAQGQYGQGQTLTTVQGQTVRFTQSQVQVQVQQQQQSQPQMFQFQNQQGQQSTLLVNGPIGMQQQQRFQFFKGQDATRPNIGQGYTVQVQRSQTPNQTQSVNSQMQMQGMQQQGYSPQHQQQHTIYQQSLYQQQQQQQQQNLLPGNQQHHQNQMIPRFQNQDVSQSQPQVFVPQNQQFLQQNSQQISSSGDGGQMAQNVQFLIQNQQFQNRQLIIQNQRAQLVLQNSQVMSKGQGQVLIQNQTGQQQLHSASTSQIQQHVPQVQQNYMVQQFHQQQQVLQQNAPPPQVNVSQHQNLSTSFGSGVNMSAAQNPVKHFIPPPTSIASSQSLEAPPLQPPQHAPLDSQSVSSSPVIQTPAPTTFVTPSAPPPRLISTMYRAILSSQNQSDDTPKQSPTSQHGGKKIRRASKPFSTGGKPRVLLNPLTGHLEPIPGERSSSESEDDEEDGGRKGKGKGMRGKSVSRVLGKPEGPTTAPAGKPKPLATLGKPGTLAVTDTSAEKIKLKLKLEHFKVDSKKEKIPGLSPALESNSTETSSSNFSNSNSIEQPRVPPLHISLRGKNSAVVVSPRRDEPGGTTPTYNPNFPPPPLTFPYFPKTGGSYPILSTNSEPSSLPPSLTPATAESSKVRKPSRTPRPKSQTPEKNKSRAKSFSMESKPPILEPQCESVEGPSSLPVSVSPAKRAKKNTRRKSDNPKGTFGLVPMMSRKDISAHVRELLPDFPPKLTAIKTDIPQMKVNSVMTALNQPIPALTKIETTNQDQSLEIEKKFQSLPPPPPPPSAYDFKSNVLPYSKSDVFRESKLGTFDDEVKLLSSDIDQSDGTLKSKRSADVMLDEKPQKRPIPDLVALVPKSPVISTPKLPQSFFKPVEEEIDDKQSAEEFEASLDIRPLGSPITVHKVDEIEMLQECEHFVEDLLEKVTESGENDVTDDNDGLCTTEPVGMLTLPIIPSKEEPSGNGNGAAGEDSGIDSMDALSEKSPNQGESPIRKETENTFITSTVPTVLPPPPLEQKIFEPNSPERLQAVEMLVDSFLSTSPPATAEPENRQHVPSDKEERDLVTYVSVAVDCANASVECNDTLEISSVSEKDHEHDQGDHTEASTIEGDAQALVFSEELQMDEKCSSPEKLEEFVENEEPKSEAQFSNLETLSPPMDIDTGMIVSQNEKSEEEMVCEGQDLALEAEILEESTEKILDAETVTEPPATIVTAELSESSKVVITEVSDILNNSESKEVDEAGASFEELQVLKEEASFAETSPEPSPMSPIVADSIEAVVKNVQESSLPHLNTLSDIEEEIGQDSDELCKDSSLAETEDQDGDGEVNPGLISQEDVFAKVTEASEAETKPQVEEDVIVDKVLAEEKLEVLETGSSASNEIDTKMETLELIGIAEEEQLLESTTLAVDANPSLVEAEDTTAPQLIQGSDTVHEEEPIENSVRLELSCVDSEVSSENSSKTGTISEEINLELEKEENLKEVSENLEIEKDVLAKGQVPEEIETVEVEVADSEVSILQVVPSKFTVTTKEEILVTTTPPKQVQSITVDLPEVEIIHTTVVSSTSVITQIRPSGFMTFPRDLQPQAELFVTKQQKLPITTSVNSIPATVISVESNSDSEIPAGQCVKAEVNPLRSISGSVNRKRKRIHDQRKEKVRKLNEKLDLTTEVKELEESKEILEEQVSTETNSTQLTLPLDSIRDEVTPNQAEVKSNVLEIPKSDILLGETGIPGKADLEQSSSKCDQLPPHLSPISPIISNSSIERVMPVSILPRFDQSQSPKPQPRFFVQSGSNLLSPLPNLVRPTQPGQPTHRVIRPIPIPPLEFKPIVKVQQGSEESNTLLSTTATTVARQKVGLEAIITALGGKTGENSGNSNQRIPTAQLPGHTNMNILNVNRIPGIRNVIQVSSANNLKHSNIISIPAGAGSAGGGGGGGPTMITIPANLSHHIQSTHQSGQGGITVLPSGHKVVPIKLLSLPSQHGMAQNRSSGSPTLIDVSNRVGSPHIFMATPRGVQSTPLNLSNVGGNITLVPISANHAQLQKVIGSSPVQVQMMVNSGASKAGQVQPTFRVVRQAGNFAEMKRETSEGVNKESAFSEHNSNFPETNSNSCEPGLPATDGESTEDLEEEEFGYEGDIIHDEQDVAVALASTQLQHYNHNTHNGLDTYDSKSAESPPPVLEFEGSPHLESQSFASIPPNLCVGDSIHGEDQEIIDSFSLSQRQGQRPQELDHTYVGKQQRNGKAKKKEGNMSELSIEIPGTQDVARNTRSNTRIVSPDITALTSSKSDTSKLPPAVAKLNTRELRNSPKPSPTGLKVGSPSTGGPFSPGLNAVANCHSSSSPIPPIQNTLKGRKRKRRESESSSASKEENGEDIIQRMDIIDLNARPGKRRCSENAAELIKACIGAEDTPKRNTMLIKRLEDARSKEAKMKKTIPTITADSDDESDSLGCGRGGRSSRGSSEDRSSSRGSTVNRHPLPSRPQQKDDEKKSGGRVNHRNTNAGGKRGKSNNSMHDVEETGSGKIKSVTKCAPAKGKSGGLKKDHQMNTTTNHKNTPTPSSVVTNSEIENPRRKTRSSAIAAGGGITESDVALGKRRRVTKD